MTEFAPFGAMRERRSAAHWLRAVAATLLVGRGAGAAAAQTMLVRALVLGINVFTGILSARLLGSVGKGDQAAIAMSQQLIRWCLARGLPTSLVYGARNDPERQGSLFSAALGSAIGLLRGALGCLAVLYRLDHFDFRVILRSQIFVLIVPYGIVSAVSTVCLLVGPVRRRKPSDGRDRVYSRKNARRYRGHRLRRAFGAARTYARLRAAV